MSTHLYDEALLKKLLGWCKGTNVNITGVNDTRRMFEVLADKQDDKPIELPLVTLSRSGGFIITNKLKLPITFNGFGLSKTKDATLLLNAIPIEIKYQIDIYTRYFEECDEYARNFIFNIINFPRLDVEIPYEDSDILHRGEIWLDSEVEDNSDIPQKLIAGQFSRLTIGIHIDNAYLWDVKIRPHYKIVEIDVDNTHNRELIVDLHETTNS